MSALAHAVSVIRPQPAQEAFLSSPADIAIYGGAAGGGKTYALLMEPARHVHRPGFAPVIFRRTSPQVRNEGGLWDTSAAIYPQLGATPREHTLEWVWPSGATVRFAHLQHDSTRFEYQGAQLPFVGFDELSHFSETVFWYLWSRMRSVSGVRPYLRATTNPEPDSWLRQFLAWWIDDATGLPIPERSGRLRWFIRDGDDIAWADRREDLARPEDANSVTFVAATIEDNPILLDADPDYLKKLRALPRVEREQLLYGNWNVRPTAGAYFKRDFWEWADSFPGDCRALRFWDLAATEPKAGRDPDWTAGAKVGIRDGRVFLEVERFRASPHDVERRIRSIAETDGRALPIWLEQEPGSAGKALASHYKRNVLPGFTVRAKPTTGSKIADVGPLSSQAEAGNVVLVRGPWAEAFVREAEAFPEGAHDDQVDAAAKGYGVLATAKVWGVA